MNRLTRPDVAVDPTAAYHIGDEASIHDIGDNLLNLILNGPTLQSVPKVTIRHLLRQLYDKLKSYEDAEAAQEAQEPLTIEELKQMNGEPVWLDDDHVWGLIIVDAKGRWAGMPFVHFYFDGVSFTWDIEKRNKRCFRHKPKEV